MYYGLPYIYIYSDSDILVVTVMTPFVWDLGIAPYSKGPEKERRPQ